MALERAASAFFQNPPKVDTSFFMQRRTCNFCNQGYSLYALIMSPPINNCLCHAGQYDQLAQEWSCCGKKDYLSRNGCVSFLHDIRSWWAESKMIGKRYVWTSTREEPKQESDTYLFVPLDIWLSLMYRRYNGSLASWTKDFAKQMEQVNYIMTLYNTEEMRKFLNLRKDAKKAESDSSDLARRLLGDAIPSSFKVLNGITAKDHTITLLVDVEEKTYKKHPQSFGEISGNESVDSEEEEDFGAMFLHKLAPQKTITSNNVFEQNYNTMIIVYSCCKST